MAGRPGGIGSARGTIRSGQLSESDPTDHALATIASILDQPETPPEVERPASGPRPAVPAMATTDGDGYSKIGPGPIFE